MIFLSRNKSGPDRLLEWKVRLFLLGAALAMGGIGLDSSLLITLATVALLAGVALRFLPTGEDVDPDDGDAEEGAPDDGGHGANRAEAGDAATSNDHGGL